MRDHPVAPNPVRSPHPVTRSPGSTCPPSVRTIRLAIRRSSPCVSVACDSSRPHVCRCIATIIRDAYPVMIGPWPQARTQRCLFFFLLPESLLINCTRPCSYNANALLTMSLQCRFGSSVRAIHTHSRAFTIPCPDLRLVQRSSIFPSVRHSSLPSVVGPQLYGSS